MHLIPAVKHLEIQDGYLKNTTVCPRMPQAFSELRGALEKLPSHPEGMPLEIRISGGNGEGYTLTVAETQITIEAETSAGAFYAIQTLRQILKEPQVPCLLIRDWPDFAYRGFYHDVTRGKIPTVDTIKGLIDEMAYYKLNVLQLYVEHVYPFEETQDLLEKTGCLTAEELREIGEYCRENFIDFQPSLSTFGHLHEMLVQPQYQHLRVRKDYEASPNFWSDRMRHHTIDPLNPQSIEVVKHLVDQYAPCFDSRWFNVCCDETFDLSVYGEQGLNVGKIYVDFVKRIIDYVKGKQLNVMMWGDILLAHPDMISELPEDVLFLNWYYRTDLKKMEHMISKFAEANRKQIVCPGTTTWNRLCENVAVEEVNIVKMIELGYKYGAVGVLNTNWGDWGNPCSLELAMYGMVLGAEKSWSVGTAVDERFYAAVNALLYQHPNGVQLLKQVSALQDQLRWRSLAEQYFVPSDCTEEELLIAKHAVMLQEEAERLQSRLEQEPWICDAYRQELILAVRGLWMMAACFRILAGEPVDIREKADIWLQEYRSQWLRKNKESELRNIEAMFRYYVNRS